MKNNLLIFAAIMLFASCTSKQVETEAPIVFSDTISLVQPREVAGLTINEALKLRQSSRDFSDEPLSLRQVSEVLWAAAGVNRENGKLTAPSALALYPLQVYAFFAEGVYRYDNQNAQLIRVAAGDFRELSAMQNFAFLAPLNIVYVADFQVYEGRDIAKDKVLFLCGQDAAGYAENVNLYCAAHGLKAITRGSLQAEKIVELLGFDTERFVPVLAQTVGK